MSRAKAGSKNSVKVEIAGERHVLRSDAPAEYTHAVAAHVDETIRAMAAGGTLEQHRAAILAALVITDELFRTREELRALREEVDRRASLIADLLSRADADGATPPDPLSDLPPAPAAPAARA